jgi:HNH endonuclease
MRNRLRMIKTMKALQQAATIMGAKGGRAGTGQAKQRFAWQCKKAAKQRWKNYGEVLPAIFWNKVQVGKVTECWPWTGTIRADGYGQVGFSKGYELSHRMAWLFIYGEIPFGMNVLHKCDFRKCCNPLHLFLGTLDDNNKDRARKGRSCPCPGEANGRAKLRGDQVKEIRRRYKYGLRTIFQLANDYSVTPAAIRFIVTGRHWKHIP